MLTVTQAQLLIALEANALNLTRAAERLHIVQPAATRQLKGLESWLGAPLFVREGKRLKAWTQLGQQVLEQARLVVMAQRNVRALAESLQNGEEEIVLGTTHTQARYFLPRRLKRFRDQFPRARLHIEQSHPKALMKMLHQGEINLALCTEAIQLQPGVKKAHCYSWHYILVCRSDHPLAEKERITLADLAHYPILTYNRGFAGGHAIEQVLAEAGLAPHFSIRAADADVIKTYVREGFGVGIIAKQAYSLQDDMDLACHDLGALLPHNETYLAWLENQFITPVMAALIELLTEKEEQANA